MTNKIRLKTYAFASISLLAAALFLNIQLSAQTNPEDKNMKEQPLPFDPEQSMKYLKEICDIGTRISGSEGIVKQRVLIKKHFEALGAKVLEQEFKAIQKSTGRPTPMVNMVITWHPTARERVILCSHFDTRPFADQETDPKKRKGTFISANDGASGVALLMEMGRHMKKLNCNIGVDFVFFDGEEFVFDPDDEYFFGSKYFAREARKNTQTIKYRSAVLLDMVAGKDAKFPIEQNSWWKAGPVVREVWSTANELKIESFKLNEFSRVAVDDDHTALNNGGIPAIDIIDFDYKHWHKLSDTPEQCSGETMAGVAKVLGSWIQRQR